MVDHDKPPIFNGKSPCLELCLEIINAKQNRKLLPKRGTDLRLSAGGLPWEGPRAGLGFPGRTLRWQGFPPQTIPAAKVDRGR